MNRDEILAKSRKENKGKSDERELQVLANSAKVGISVGAVLCVLIVVFSRIVDMPEVGLASWTIYFSMFGSYSIYHFIKTRNKHRLIQGIIGIVVGVTCLVGMIILGLM